MRVLYARGLSVLRSDMTSLTRGAISSASMRRSPCKISIAAFRGCASESLSLRQASLAAFSAALGVRVPRGPAFSPLSIHLSRNSRVDFRARAFFCFRSSRAVGRASDLSSKWSKLKTLPKIESRHLPTAAVSFLSLERSVSCSSIGRRLGNSFSPTPSASMLIAAIALELTAK